jgi:PTS system mannose-specific IIA component
MIGTLILTHGGVARELLAAVEEIAGEQANFEAVSLDWDDECDAAQAKIGAALARMQGVDGILILTDTYGGTPCNLAMTFYEPGRVEVVSGVNLPMVMRLACNGNRQGAELAELAHWLETKGRQSICVAGDLAQRGRERSAGDAPAGTPEA